jgi:integrase
MSEVNQRLWKIPGQRTKRKAWGFTVQVPCAPCPHRHPKTGAVVHPDGVRQLRKYRAGWTQDDAEQALAEALLPAAPAPALPTRENIRFGEASERYLATKSRKRSLREDTRILKHLTTAFGKDTPLAEITASRISEYKAERLGTMRTIANGQTTEERRLSAAAVNRPLALLRHLLRLAHEEWEVLEHVPRVRLEKEPQGRLRWLTQQEIARLLDACARSKNTQLRAAVVVALNTGLRLGELVGLVWERVDLSRGVIRLETTKSGRRREVPLNDDSYAALVSLTQPPRSRKSKKGTTPPSAAAHAGDRSGPVFRARYIKTAYNNAVQSAKLEDVNFHTLRHTFASWAVMRGVSLKELQELLGHASLAMTMRYAHLAPEHLRTAVSRLQGLVAPPAAEPAHDPLSPPKSQRKRQRKSPSISGSVP